MTKLQETIFGIMKVFDRLCRDNDLCYYMLGGTMLGAVRHKGFIPWDDDADFGLPREDYERLLALPKEAVPQGFRLRHFSKEAGVPYAFARLEDENTTCIEARRSGSGYTGGVYIDIFPLDADSNVSIFRRWKEWRVKLIKKLLYAHIAEEGKVTNPLKRVIMKAAAGKTKQEALVVRLDAMVSAYGRKNLSGRRFLRGETRLSNYLGHWGRRESVPRSIFDGKSGQRGYAVFDWRRGERIAAPSGGREYEFEGSRFFGAADSAAYLTALYGADYMTPPPEERREGHPAVVIELSKPYRQENGDGGAEKADQEMKRPEE